METLEFVLNNPYKAELFLVCVAAILLVQGGIKLYDYFIERFEIETKSSKREKFQMQQIEQLKTEVNEVKSELNEIKDYSQEAKKKRVEFEECTIKALNDIREDLVDVRINALRNKIIDFSANCRIKDYDKEAFDNCLQDFDEYRSLIKKYGRSNSRIDMAMINVRKKYEEYLEKGFPTY